jgi:hypothetical protein
MDKVIAEIERQIDYLNTRTRTASDLKRSSENLDGAQKWYDACLAARLEDEQLIAEYQVALEILRLRGVRS